MKSKALFTTTFLLLLVRAAAANQQAAICQQQFELENQQAIARMMACIERNPGTADNCSIRQAAEYKDVTSKFDACSERALGISSAESSVERLANVDHNQSTYEIVFEGLRASTSGTLGNEYVLQLKNTGARSVICQASVQYSFLSVGAAHTGSRTVTVLLSPNRTGIGKIAQANDVIQGRQFPTNITSYNRSAINCKSR